MRKHRIRLLILAVALIVIAGSGASMFPYCQAQTYMHASQQTTNTTRIIVGGVVLIVELAETAAVQQNALSGRLALPIDHGMLFVFNHQDYWSFWMVNMRFPLDIIWFNSGRQVIFVKAALPPCPSPENCPIFTPTDKAMYVLEVNAGFVGAHNISLGNSFVFLDRLDFMAIYHLRIIGTGISKFIANYRSHLLTTNT